MDYYFLRYGGKTKNTDFGSYCKSGVLVSPLFLLLLPLMVVPFHVHLSASSLPSVVSAAAVPPLSIVASLPPSSLSLASVSALSLSDNLKIVGARDALGISFVRGSTLT